MVVANAADRVASAEVTAMGDGTATVTTVEVPAYDRVRIEADELLNADWAGLSVEVLGGDATVQREVVGPDGFSVSPCASQASPEWFVPSGSTLLGAEEHLVLFNPFPDSTSVDVTFATDDGPRSPAALRAFSVPGRSVRVIPFEELPARRPEVATTVRARSGRLVVDRVQVHDGTGQPLGGDGADTVLLDVPQGLASTPASAAAPRWFFPDAMVTPGTRTRVAVYNPGDEDAEVDLVVTHEEPARLAEIDPFELSIRPREVAVVDLTDQAGITEDVGFTIDVRSLEGVPVVAEQLVYAKAPLEPSTPVEADAGDPGASGDPGDLREPEPVPDAEVFPDAGPDAEPEAAETLEGASASPVPGFTVAAGSPVAATDWFLAGRGDDGDRNALVVVANPGTEPVTVQVEELTGGRRGAVGSATVSVPGGDRRVLDLEDASSSAALLIAADGPVVVAQGATAQEGRGISQMLATPLPDTVRDLPVATAD
ncbi:hypothetical protein BH20ACT3_BH20ACT3_09890 [soil metagenome]